MYNKQWFEVGDNYKVIGNYCICRYDKSDLFDNDDIIGIITKYNCNNTVAYLHTDGVIEKCPLFDNGDKYYIFGLKMLRRIHNASKHDKRAYDFWENKIDDYNHEDMEDIYILRYGKNDLLK